MDLFEFCCGRWGKVVFATERSGKHLAAEFLDGLSIPDQVKMGALIKRFADFGEIKNREKFKKIGRDLFEFKSGQIRMFCFMEPSTLILTHGCIKKRDRLNQAEITRAERIRTEHQQIYKPVAGTTGVQRRNQ